MVHSPRRAGSTLKGINYVLTVLALAALSPTAAAAITAEFTSSGGYVVRRGGEVLLQSAASPAAVHRDGRWCECLAEKEETVAAACSLRLAGSTSGIGTDAIGRFNRTELRWSDSDGVVFITAMRVYDKGEVRQLCQSC